MVQVLSIMECIMNVEASLGYNVKPLSQARGGKGGREEEEEEERKRGEVGKDRKEGRNRRGGGRKGVDRRLPSDNYLRPV